MLHVHKNYQMALAPWHVVDSVNVNMRATV